MYPSRSALKAQERRARLAKASAGRARSRLRLRLRNTAVSPGGLLAGFAFGVAAGWFMGDRSEISSRRHSWLSLSGLFVPLLQMLYAETTGEMHERGKK